jgi:7,8-dihydro-6-hydroxymethylpterin dimethyltransferase
MLEAARHRMRAVFSPNQILGRTQTTGCTAVEITQRCNLDCTLCYLSEHSESVRDIPIEAVFARLDHIREYFGPGTHVQITGGDPTLRKHGELVDIVAYARKVDLFPALFTNGIAATRPLLARLAAAGLVDVAFHVDTTQQRAGYASEESLHPLRDEYLARARGLGLNVMFNTTVHAGNLAAIPHLVRFFVARAADVGMASFQLQAETGRGEWGARADVVSLFSVRAAVEVGAGCRLPWDAIRVGHPDCHSYVPTLVFAERVVPVMPDADLFAAFVRDFGGAAFAGPAPLRSVRHAPAAAALAWSMALLRHPRWLPRILAWLGRTIRAAGPRWILRRVPPRKLSFFVHNFMDAAHLDQARIDACSFQVMTHAGPVSMCAHNARRDEYILQPLTIRRRDGSEQIFEPLRAVPPGRRAPAREEQT